MSYIVLNEGICSFYINYYSNGTQIVKKKFRLSDIEDYSHGNWIQMSSYSNILIVLS